MNQVLETFKLVQGLVLFFGFWYCSGQCVPKTFLKKKPFENKLITDFSLWNKTGLGSSNACVRDCVRDEKCVSFFYNKRRDVCTAHKFQFLITEANIPDEGSGYYVANQLPVEWQDCADTLTNDPTAQDGVFSINPQDGQGSVRVYCDMTTDGGGWIVFQRRQDGSTDFRRSWADYKNGFGDLSAEFWLGNDIISRLTNARALQLRVDMLTFDNQPGVATYSLFKVDNETNDYNLTVSGYQGTAGDSLGYHNGMRFSTMDRDNDGHSAIDCAAVDGAWWWHRDCGPVALNGVYGEWIDWRPWSYGDIKWTEMKMRPAQ